VTQGLHRIYGAHHLHFITCSCYRRWPELGSAWWRDLFLQLLEEARCKYRFVVHGYVVMPEHFHLLMSEPQVGDPSVVMKVVKERFSRQVHRKRAGTTQMWLWKPEPVWQKRFYDFNVWTERKRVEKLRYMHRNPVKRGLVLAPEQWAWSSFRAYAYGERGVVGVRLHEWPLEMKRRPVESFGGGESRPLIRKVRE
jgi:putative transposase